MKKNTKFLTPLFLLIIFLLFLKIDFRFTSSIECCGDDFDYYIHAKTLAIDGDFQYDNNLEFNSYFYYFNEKIAPKGFVGSGILASPFLLIGYSIDNFFNISGVFNFEILFYSLSAVFYVLLSVLLIKKSFNKLEVSIKKFNLLIIIFGSGIVYYSFERFSMTHSYEFFINSLLFYFVTNFLYESNNLKLNILSFFIPLVVCVGILVRLTNLYVLFLPYLFKLLIFEKNNKNNYFYNKAGTYIGFFCSLILYYSLSISIYGKLILDPRIVYGESKNLQSLILIEDNLISTFFKYFKDLINIHFGNEFGLFWISPIIFLFLPIAFYYLYIKKYKIAALLFIIFIQTFGSIIIWQSTASSYGYRYVFSIIPVAIVCYFLIDNPLKKYIDNIYLTPMSLFSLVSILFFETNSNTQLSIIEIENSFGKLTKYSQPRYVTGYLNSFFEFENYMIIFVTSFLGVIAFKFLIYLIGGNNLLLLLTNFGLPTNNSDFLTFYSRVENISVIKLVLITLFFLIFSVLLYNLENKEN